MYDLMPPSMHLCLLDLDQTMVMKLCDVVFSNVSFWVQLNFRNKMG
uniref:Uncharacterized protein n=1 Tax=Arundo donax TaxID=35708 RepID=A0A0A9ARU3_ARUDO